MSGRQVGYVVARSLGVEVMLRHTWTALAEPGVRSPGACATAVPWRRRETALRFDHLRSCSPVSSASALAAVCPALSHYCPGA